MVYDIYIDWEIFKLLLKRYIYYLLAIMIQRLRLFDKIFVQFN